jgi:23S rRNA pseudouridine2605 synthase
LKSIRLNRYLAQAGLGSRRAVEALIQQGHIAINGHPILTLATQVHPEDIVTCRGKRIAPQRHIYAVLHKPKGYTCTALPREGEKNIYQLLPPDWPRVFYVGRLDKESEGLLILTNDGLWAQQLAHPRYKLPKIYHVTLNRPFDSTHIEKLKKGMVLPEGRARIDHLHILTPIQLRITLTQGLKRQIREMLYRVGYEVKRLVRVQYGSLNLKGLPLGHVRLLTPKEIRALTSGCFKATSNKAKNLTPESSKVNSRPLTKAR